MQAASSSQSTIFLLGAKALIVDSFEEDAKDLKDRLSGYGVECTVVAEGGAAKEQIESNDYDMIFTELMLPPNGGVELVNWIQERPKKPATFVVSRLSESAADELKGFMFIRKPYHKVYIERALKSI